MFFLVALSAENRQGHMKVLEWLHEGCDSDLSVDFRNFGAINFPFKIPFEKCFKIVFFSVWRRDPVLELQFPKPLRNSVSADRIVMAASRLLGTAPACVILLSFAAGSRKWYWSGCMKAATVIYRQIFSILAVVTFLLKVLFKSAAKSYNSHPTCYTCLLRRGLVLQTFFHTVPLVDSGTSDFLAWTIPGASPYSLP